MCTNTMQDMYMYCVSYFILDATQKTKEINKHCFGMWLVSMDATCICVCLQVDKRKFTGDRMVRRNKMNYSTLMCQTFLIRVHSFLKF